MTLFGCLKLKARISGPNEVQEFIGVFADERLQVIAGDIVLELQQISFKLVSIVGCLAYPFQPIVIEVVQDRQA